MKYVKKVPDIYLTAESACLVHFVCVDLLHRSCLHAWWCYHPHGLPLQKVLRPPLCQDRWDLQIASKLVNMMMRIRSLTYQAIQRGGNKQPGLFHSKMIPPCLPLLPLLPCCPLPVDKPMNPGATLTGRMERKNGLTPTIALGSTSKCLNKGVSHLISSSNKVF